MDAKVGSRIIIGLISIVVLAVLIVGAHYYVTYMYPKASSADIENIKQADLAHWGGSAKYVSIKDVSRFGPFYTYAFVNEGPDGGSTVEWAKKQPDGSFVLLGAWQEVPECNFFVQNNIPAQLTSQCVDTSTSSKEVVYAKNPVGYIWW